jgi:hypothetical protein
MSIFAALFQIITVLALIWSIYNFYHVWTRPPKAPARPTGPRPVETKPGSNPTTRVQFPASLEAGAAAHQQRGAAKTAKLPVIGGEQTPAVATDKDDDEAMQTLFANVPVDKKSAPEVSNDPGTEAARKASRMAELGFHHSINPNAPAASAAPSAAATLMPTDAAPTAPRSNTAELNAILERIDQFLAEDPKESAKPVTAETGAADKTEAVAQTTKAEMMPATVVVHSTPNSAPLEPKPAAEAVPAAPAETPAISTKTTPLWARADAVDEDVSKPEDKPGEQQRLF